MHPVECYNEKTFAVVALGVLIWFVASFSAARIFSSIYIFCDEEEKKQIKNAFSLEELIEIPDNEFSDYEVSKIADTYDEKENYLMAIRWYRIGAERGKAHAEYKLGEYYEEGRATEIDLKTAFAWYIKAAKHGSVLARRKMAPLYFNGSEYCEKRPYLAKEYWISVYIEFCGLKTIFQGFKLRFWLKNKSDTSYNIWAKKIILNEVKIESFKKIGECKDNDCHYETLEFEKTLKVGDTIELAVEIDDENDNPYAFDL